MQRKCISATRWPKFTFAVSTKDYLQVDNIVHSISQRQLRLSAAASKTIARIHFFDDHSFWRERAEACYLGARLIFAV